MTAQEQALQIGATVRAFYRKRAISFIGAAVKSGRLPRLVEVETPCVHCGQRAYVHEHRDYTDPMNVLPTCDSCNFRLGPAILDPGTVIDHIRYSPRFPFRNVRLQTLAARGDIYQTPLIAFNVTAKT